MNKKQRLITLNAILLFLLFSTCVVKAQVYVKFDATGTNNGTSWANAYTNLDSALNKTASGEIWVAAGTYKPSINLQYYTYPVFNITRKIALYGGFKGDESSLSQRNLDNNPTILSGDVGVADYDLDNTPAVLAITGGIVDSTCIVDGFTITKAYYTNGVGSYQNAAVYIYTANNNPIVRNCTIKNNFGFYGAGIYVRSARPLLYNNLITNNTAYEGAGIYLDYGGNARVVGNRIVNNKCVGGYTNLSGGGIKVEAYCAPYIYGNLIDNNYAGTYGGGISVETNNNIAVIANNIISNNTSRDGGGVYVDFTATDMINNLIVGNKATNNGGGMHVNYSFASRSINNTIVGNSAEGNGGGVYLFDGNMQLTNTIIYSNPTKYGKQFNSTNPNRTDWFPKMDYCDIEDGKQGITFSNPAAIDNIWRTGNIASSPQFIDTASSNYRLLAGSACVEAGSPDTAGLHLPSTDIAGANRFSGSRIDIGCYEYNSLFVYKDSLSISPATVNLEGKADSTFNLTISSNAHWTVMSKPDWINVHDTVGVNSAVVKVTAVKNPNVTDPRSGKIIFSRAGIAPTVQVTVNQSRSAYLTVLPDTLYIKSQQNDSAIFSISSNIAWYINSYTSTNWLSVDKRYWSNDAMVVAKATANKTAASRTAYATVYSNVYNLNPTITKQIVIVQQPGYFILCQNSSDSISAVLNSPGYQWQVDTGSGFANINDNDHYKGTSSKWLKLTNIPSFYSGNKYRCLINFGYSDVLALSIQNSWQGTINQQWENPLNWSCGVLPDANTDVVINAGNIVVNANTTIRSLTISSGAKLTVSSGVQLNVLK